MRLILIFLLVLFLTCTCAFGLVAGVLLLLGLYGYGITWGHPL